MKLKFSLVVVCLFFISACGTLKRRDSLQPNSANKKTTAIQGEDSPENSQEPDWEIPGEESSPLEDTTINKKVALVLGPGGMKTFAHIGVLKALEQAKVPIDTIVGLEWGSLVAGIYAQKGQIHDLEWRLYKLNKEDLPEKGMFSSKYNGDSIAKLNKYFSDNLIDDDIKQFSIEFKCPSLSVWTGLTVWQSRGPLKKVIEKCMPYPPLFKPSSPWMAGAFSAKESIQNLKQNGYNIVILVDVMGKGDFLTQKELMEDYKSAILWQEVKRNLNDAKHFATDVIEVETKSKKMYDFDQRAQLTQIGELEGKRRAQAIVKKYGF